MFRIPIICSGGIGDTLLQISGLPISILGQFGVRFSIFYEDKDHPAWKILQIFLESIQYCQLCERNPTKFEYRIRNILDKFTRQSSYLYAPPIPCGTKESGFQGRRILIQTHLDGHHGHTHVTAKIWSLERWCDLFFELQKLGWSIELLEWNEVAFLSIKNRCSFISDARRQTLLETIQLINRCQCVVSVDSWTKYVAAWRKIPQVVIVPDLRKGYTPVFEKISATQVANRWFKGLTNSRSTRLIGLEKIHGEYAYTLSSIAELTVQDILKCISKF